MHLKVKKNQAISINIDCTVQLLITGAQVNLAMDNLLKWVLDAL